MSGRVAGLRGPPEVGGAHLSLCSTLHGSISLVHATTWEVALHASFTDEETEGHTGRKKMPPLMCASQDSDSSRSTVLTGLTIHPGVFRPLGSTRLYSGSTTGKRICHIEVS